jgi:hypothetical protein
MVSFSFPPESECHEREQLCQQLYASETLLEPVFSQPAGAVPK